MVAEAPASVAENAINVLFAAVVFPVGTAALLSKIFPNRNDVVIAGAFTCLFSAAFPLRMLTVHGPFPNVAAFCLIPSACTLFMRILDSSRETPFRPTEIPVFLVACIGLAGTHPNAIFSCVVLMLPYLTLEVVPQFVKSKTMLPTTAASKIIRLVQIAVVALAIVGWVSLLQTSIFTSVANFIWQFEIDPLTGVLSILDAGYYLGISQPVLAVLIALGLVFCLRHQKTRWPVISYLVAALIFLLGLALDYQSRKLITGYWYIDPERTAALLAIAAVPLSAFGLGTLGSKIGSGIRKTKWLSSVRKWACSCSVVILALPLSGLNYLIASPAPITGEIETSFSFSADQVNRTYSFDETQPYTVRERAFVQRALEVIPDNALVIYLPHDGSVFSSPVDGMNVYYKSCRPSEESLESEVIRARLNQIAPDCRVQQAVQETGARYVLLLGGVDQSAEDLYTPLATHHESMWSGLIITDDTPEFRCALADGELRLYELIG